MAKINASFLEIVGKSFFNKSEWNPTGDAFTLKEVFEAQGIKYDDIQGDEAEVTVAEFEDGSSSLRLTVTFKNGQSIELKGGKNIQNNFDEGDKVKVDLIYAQQLDKAGQPSIIRYDVWKSEEAKNEYLAQRG
jgi:hypothetical protein